jgi:hypothetical protein
MLNLLHLDFLMSFFHIEALYLHEVPSNLVQDHVFQHVDGLYDSPHVKCQALVCKTQNAVS